SSTGHSTRHDTAALATVCPASDKYAQESYMLPRENSPWGGGNRFVVEKSRFSAKLPSTKRWVCFITFGPILASARSVRRQTPLTNHQSKVNNLAAWPST